jgi:hypothetical protein
VAEKHGKGHGKDQNGDGLSDLVLHFKTMHSGIQCGDHSVGLVGFTSTGLRIEGEAPIRTVGCRQSQGRGVKGHGQSDKIEKGKGKRK